MRIRIKQKGNFVRTIKYLKKVGDKATKFDFLKKYGIEGVEALREATPKLTGLTSESWYYTIEEGDDKVTLSYCNSNIQNGTPIALIIQYGHATKDGYWIEGRDYINPAIANVFDDIIKRAWREVTEL